MIVHWNATRAKSRIVTTLKDMFGSLTLIAAVSQ
jgi:hypothetical protein